MADLGKGFEGPALSPLISNLKFVSKLVEKAVCVQLTDYIISNGLSETFQSAYKSFHSTETALLRVQNDILCALDRYESVILVLLDLLAAFDTVDHTLLATRLSTCFGFQGTVLKWLKSYLSSRKLFVKVGNSHSSQRALKCGVPQNKNFCFFLCIYIPFIHLFIYLF